jgi:small subunit ribosomal protein S21
LAEVNVHEGESLESALKRFKRKVMAEEIIKDIRRHACYLKPGQKVRVKAALARKRSRKNRSRDSESDASRK